MSECEVHKCEDCEKYSEEEGLVLWPCVWSNCPHHPEVECQFIPKED